MSDRIHARIDHKLKQDVSTILGQLGLTESEAIRLFYLQIINHRGIPFDIKLPNKETIDTFRKTDAGLELTHHDNVADIFKKL